jgi:replicative DNA helicase
MDTPLLILKNFLFNDEFVKKTLPFTNPEHFELEEYQRVVKAIKELYLKREIVPTINLLKVMFNDKIKGIHEKTLKKIITLLDYLDTLKSHDKEDINNLLVIAEDYFVKRDLNLSLLKSVKILEENKGENYKSIPTLLEESLKISLINKDVGWEYGAKDSITRQIDYYKNKRSKYPSHLENLNKLIGGGFEKKTLNLFLGEPGIGKSRLLTDLSVHFIKKGYNVLYISLELSDNSIYQRIDANLLDVNINELRIIDNDLYFSKVEEIKKLVIGKLFIKEYPAESISKYDIKNLLDDIKNNKSVVIDILVIDFLTVMKTVKNLGNNAGNLYITGKYIATEMHSLAKEYNLILLSAVHLNRPGWGNLDVKLGNVAESAGIVHFADLTMALNSTEEMRNRKRMQVKVLKNRLYSISEGDRVLVGYDDSRMRHFDISETLEDIIEKNKNDEIDMSDFKL